MVFPTLIDSNRCFRTGAYRPTEQSGNLSPLDPSRFSLQETAESSKSITFKGAAGPLLREHIRVAKVLRGVYPGKAIRQPSAP